MLQIKRKTKTPNARDLYLIGAASWLLADLLSDQDNIKVLRGLKEQMPNLNYLARASLAGSGVFEACDKYTRKIEKGKHIPSGDSPASKEAMEQFLQSSQYLERWINVLFEVSPSRHAELDKKIRLSIEEVKGKRKTATQQALQWLETQPEEISKKTVFNKLVQLNNS